jgi:hypothetical protein
MARTELSKSSKYIAPKELMNRWQCSRSQVPRIAERLGLRKLLPGKGKNGMVRYLREEVEQAEQTRLI